MSAIKLVIFDMAGTIIEDHGEVVSAFSAALERNGIPFSKEEVKRRMGASKREVIRHFAEQVGTSAQLGDMVENTYRSFRAELERLYEERIRPIEGAAATFQWCRDHGIQMATTTGFYREIANLILGKTCWKDVFTANISSTDVRLGRPAPYMIFRAMEACGVQKVQEVINVGDTPLDLQSADNAGVRGNIGVLSGSYDRQGLEREQHTHLIGSVAELPTLIECEY